MNFIETLREKRLKWIEANRENGFEDGIKNLLTELYPDNAHFIYELLQNAEDAQATKVKFKLCSQRLIFQHDGKHQFTESDIESITSIGQSTKKEDFNQIGKFGVGFKAVFSYTQTPKIYSGGYAFEIHDLVCPQKIPQTLNGDKRITKFEFPFDNSEKYPETAVDEISTTLWNLPENTILFLQNIKEIAWEIDTESEDANGTGYIKQIKSLEQENYVCVEKESYEVKQTHWLRFTNPVPNKEGLFVAVAFRLALDEKENQNTDENISSLSQFKIKATVNGEAVEGDVSIFFPAEKENSNLKFYLHAPFAATVARDSIQNRPENNELRNLLVELLIESLPRIKDFGLLDSNFLGVLPNNDDHLSQFYEPFRGAVIQAFQTEDLTPTWKNNFAPANNLLQTNKEIKNIVNKDTILPYIVDDEKVNYDFDWTINTKIGTRVYDFLESLEIIEWSWETLLRQVSKTFCSQENANNFLKKFSDEWLQSFYILLGKAKQENLCRCFSDDEKIESAYIVCLEDGSFVKGKDVFFQTEFVKNSRDVQIVKASLYKSGTDTQQTKAEEFLKLVGVKEFGEKDEILTILKQHYTLQNPRYTKEQNLKHLEKFIDFWRRNPNECNIFSDFNFLEFEKQDLSKNTLARPSEVFIDTPYKDTKLSLVEDFLNQSKLWSEYGKAFKNKTEFISFLENVGVTSTLVDKFNQINWFDKTLKNKTRELSLLFWETMCRIDKDFSHLPYNTVRNEPHGNTTSKLLKDLAYYAWIPDKSGVFHAPQEMTREMLPDDFPFNNKNKWLTAIGFGVNTEKLSENREREKALIEQEKTNREKAAKSLGFQSNEDVEEAKRLLQLRKAGRIKIKDERKEKEFNERQTNHLNFIGAESEHNFSLRQRNTEVRERSVIDGYVELKAYEARPFLKSEYTNGRELICQICQEEMPFKTIEGEYFFVAVKAIEKTAHDSIANYICCCPNCAAMYQYANKYQANMESLILDVDEDDAGYFLLIDLADNECEIRFTNRHFEELRNFIKKAVL